MPSIRLLRVYTVANLAPSESRRDIRGLKISSRSRARRRSATVEPAPLLTWSTHSRGGAHRGYTWAVGSPTRARPRLGVVEARWDPRGFDMGGPNRPGIYFAAMEPPGANSFHVSCVFYLICFHVDWAAVRPQKLLKCRVNFFFFWEQIASY